MQGIYASGKEAVREALEKAKREMLEKQRNCAWCDFHADSADALVEHIQTKHPCSPNVERV